MINILVLIHKNIKEKKKKFMILGHFFAESVDLYLCKIKIRSHIY